MTKNFSIKLKDEILESNIPFGSVIDRHNYWCDVTDELCEIVEDCISQT